MNTKFPLPSKIFDDIRKSYQNWKPKTCPYDYYKWRFILSPIEWNVWQDIRYLGLPFYPQWPIGKYFTDFADPIQKIAIEVDGAEWHKNLGKDKKREEEITKNGWQVFRIQGRQTYNHFKDSNPEDSSEGILKSIFINYYYLAYD